MWDASPSPNLETLATHHVFLRFLLFFSFVFTWPYLLSLLIVIVVTLSPNKVALSSLADGTGAVASQLPAAHLHILQLEVYPALLSAWPIQQVIGLLVLTETKQAQAGLAHSRWVARDIRTPGRLGPLPEPFPQCRSKAPGAGLAPAGGTHLTPALLMGQAWRHITRCNTHDTCKKTDIYPLI